MICAGSLITKFLSPYIRTHVETNNFAAFGVLGGCLVLGVVAFCFGSYNTGKRVEVAVDVRTADIFRCIVTAMRVKFCCARDHRHWLERVEHIYGVDVVQSAKAVVCSVG